LASGTCENDHSIRIWDIESNMMYKEIIDEELGKTNAITSIDENYLLATSSKDIRVYDILN